MAQTYVIGRVTADLELKTSINKHPYVRFDIAENIGSKEHRRTQYLQICAMGDDAERLVRARVKKGSLIWVSGSLELEVYTRRDGVTTDKRLKEHENRKARALLHQLNPKDFSAAQWKDTIEYLYKDV